MSTKALLCGRGRSLKHYKNLQADNFDFVCLVNEFNRFIKEDEELLHFLKTLSKNSFLTQQVNICASGVDQYLLNNLDIKEITSTRLSFNGDRNWWRDPVDTGILNNLNREIVLQPEIISSHMSHVENSLGVAILNLILEKECNEITIIGSDFYEDDYYLSHKEYDWEETSKKETQDRLKKGFDYLIKTFSRIRFNIYTCSTYENDSSNCNITRLE
jgi:hypothetical protein